MSQLKKKRGSWGKGVRGEKGFVGKRDSWEKGVRGEKEFVGIPRETIVLCTRKRKTIKNDLTPENVFKLLSQKQRLNLTAVDSWEE